VSFISQKYKSCLQRRRRRRRRDLRLDDVL